MSNGSKTSLKAGMKLPEFRPGTRSPSPFSASDMNLYVRAINSLLNTKVVRGSADKFEVSDENAVLQLAVTPYAPQGTSSTPSYTPLDAAVYAEGTGSAILAMDGTPTENNNNRAQLYGVRGGYVYKLNEDGSIASYSRFSYLSFSPSAICYDVDHDKLFVAYWNEWRADDALTVETTNWKRIYRVNPDTLAVEASLTIAARDDPTEFFSGPNDLIYANGKIYCLEPFSQDLLIITPDFATTTDIHAVMASSGWCNLAYDSINSRIWITTASDQEIYARGLDGSDIGWWPCGQTWVYTPTNVDCGTVSPDLSGTPVYWGSMPAGIYTIEYLTGAAHRVQDGNDVYQIFEPVAGAGFQGWNGSSFITEPLRQSGTFVFNSIADCETFNAGASGFFSIFASTNIGMEGYNWDTGIFNIADAMSFKLTRTMDIAAGTVAPFNSYGLCYCPVGNRIYIASRTSTLGVFNVAATAMGTMDLGDSNAMPYRVRYSPGDQIILVPTCRTNKVIGVDPATGGVIGSADNIEACLDVIFSANGSKKWAVCQGQRGIIPFTLTK